MTSDGLIIVDKPGGMTSHDVVARVRRLARTRRVGHGGTLDPMATGVLVIGVNRATRLLTYVVGAGKSYTATIRLGQATVTDDAEGDVTSAADASGVTDAAVRAALAAQTGEIRQVPSAVSAIKINGVRAYKRVRDGEAPELAARPVTVHELAVLAIRRAPGPQDRGAPGPQDRGAPGPQDRGAPASQDRGDQGAGAPTRRPDTEPAPDHADLGVVDVDVAVTCSSGTYIRAIARDAGAALGVGGHLTALRRTAVGGFTLAEAVTLADLEARAPDVVTLPLAQAARACLPGRAATAEEAGVLSHGGSLAPAGLVGPYAVFGPDGSLVAVVADRDGRARPEAVFAAG